MTTFESELDEKEREFRALLLKSAVRLDVPGRASEIAALARLGQATPAFRDRRQAGVSKRGLVLSSLGLAAGAVLFLSVAPLRSRIVVRAEPDATLVKSTPAVSRTPAEASLSRVPERVPTVPARNGKVRPLAAPTASVPGVVESEVGEEPDAEQVSLVRQSLEGRNLSPGLLALPAAHEANERVEGEGVSPVVVWDGDAVGLNASGWSGPSAGTKTISVVADAGFSRSHGLRWQAQGKGWMGFGWNWFSWWPSNAGTDISRHQSLAFRLRVESKVAAGAATRAGFTVHLVSSVGSGKRATRSVQLGALVSEDFCDGEWHKIVVPVRTLVGGDATTGFDSHRVWELDVGYWSTEMTTFTAYLDDIGFE